MKKKNFHPKILFLIHFSASFIIILSGTILFTYTFSNQYWNRVGLVLMFTAIGLMILLVAINPISVITIDYANKEVLSSIKFYKDQEICIPFDSITRVYTYDYMYDSELLISEINSKKYPKTTLVIEQAFNKVYIPLKFFDDQTIRALVEELQNVKVYAWVNQKHWCFLSSVYCFARSHSYINTPLIIKIRRWQPLLWRLM